MIKSKLTAQSPIQEMVSAPVLIPHSSVFTVANLLKNIAIILMLVGINKAGMPGNVAFYAILCIWALTSTQNAIKALSVGVLALVANTYFVTKSPAFSMGRFAIVFVCAARIFYDAQAVGWFKQYRPAAISLAVFTGVAGLLSIFVNYYLVVSLLKLLNFAVGAFAILAGVEVLRKKSGEITCWMMSITCSVAIMGIASIALGQGYNGKELDGIPTGLFNGPFYHSNTLGPLCGMMVVYLMAIGLCTPYRLRKLAWPVMLIMIVFILMTRSRTAVASCLVGTAAFLTAVFLLSRGKATRLRVNLSAGACITSAVASALILLIAIAIKGDVIWDGLKAFAVKTDTVNQVTIDDVLSSRRGQIDMVWYNFKQVPLTGIGFGTALGAAFEESATWYSAPTEKGNLMLGTLEETGIFGGVALLTFILSVYRVAWTSFNAVTIGVFTTFLFVNMGEMMFFSFGGHGAFAWVIVGAALALGDRCIINQSSPR